MNLLIAWILLTYPFVNVVQLLVLPKDYSKVVNRRVFIFGLSFWWGIYFLIS